MKYKRVLLKITGEALKMNSQSFNEQAVDFLSNEIQSVYKKVDLAIVIGGGNVVRGKDLLQRFPISAATADQIGMIATIMNALLLRDYLQKRKIETRVMSTIQAHQLAEDYIIQRAIRHLEKGRIIIIAGGTGRSGVTTDTAAVLSALDIQANIIMKGTKVNGIYDSDPIINPRAKLLKSLTYDEFLKRNLSGILDQAAVAQAKMNKLPILVFNIFRKGNLLKACQGRVKGSIIS